MTREFPGVTLHLGDCLEVLPTIEAGSVDLILSDLPYGTTACKWDSVIPFEPLWACFKHVLKPRGAVVLTASQPFTSMLVMSNREWFKYCLVWEKNRLTNFYNVKHQPGKSHEDILVFSGSPASQSVNLPMTFNPQMDPGDPWKKKDISSGRHSFHSAKKPRERVSDGGRYPRSVLRFTCEFEHHPTQKPVALFEYLIKTYSNEGETVLDATIGSGTTAVAAINTGRNCIGIERDSGYFDIACRRVTEALDRTALLNPIVS